MLHCILSILLPIYSGLGNKTKYFTSSNLAELSALSTNKPSNKKLYPSFLSKEFIVPRKRFTCSIAHSVKFGKSDVEYLFCLKFIIS